MYLFTESGSSYAILWDENPSRCVYMYIYNLPTDASFWVEGFLGFLYIDIACFYDRDAAALIWMD